MRRKKYVGKILKTSDGYLRGKIIKYKNRLVVVIAQRSDGAVALSKIHSIDGKSSNDLLEKVILNPKKHKSLTKKSAVDTSVIWGKPSHEAFYINNFFGNKPK